MSGHAPPTQPSAGAPGHRRNRRNNAKERRRHRLRPLETWAREVGRIEAAVRTSRGLARDEVVASRQLIFEVVRLADPCAVTGLDVVIPGSRTDLARRWMEARLDGVHDRRALRCLAQELAPLPDEHLIPYFDAKTGRTRWRSTNKRQDEITRAAEEHFRRREPLL